MAAEIEKRRLELEAEAEAEQIRRKAKGEADAIFARMQAEANGMREMLTKQAAGFEDLVRAAGGGADEAMRMMIADKLEELMKIQVDAISNIKIDKVTVWDNGSGANGKTATADFLSGMMKSVPPLGEVFSLAGMSLPTVLGKREEAESAAPAITEAAEVTEVTETAEATPAETPAE